MLFDDELRYAIETLREQPTIGAVYRTVDGEVVRRLLLPKTAQHVYYAVDDANGIIIVHSVWGARRGRGPRL
jgi:plasmid stabilization system protein ParE